MAMCIVSVRIVAHRPRRSSAAIETPQHPFAFLLVVGGGETLRVVATRQWRSQRAQALDEAARRIGATA